METVPSLLALRGDREQRELRVYMRLRAPFLEVFRVCWVQMLCEVEGALGLNWLSAMTTVTTLGKFLNLLESHL